MKSSKRRKCKNCGRRTAVEVHYLSKSGNVFKYRTKSCELAVCACPSCGSDFVIELKGRR